MIKKMNNEYIIINKSQIEKRIEEWETELQECFKAPIGKLILIMFLLYNKP